MEYNEHTYKCSYCGREYYGHTTHRDRDSVLDRHMKKYYIIVEDIPTVRCLDDRCRSYRYSIFTNRIGYAKSIDLFYSLLSDITLYSDILISWENILRVVIVEDKEQRSAALCTILDSTGVVYKNGV